MNNGEPEGPIWSMTFNLASEKLTGWLAKDSKVYKKVHGKCYCG